MKIKFKIKKIISIVFLIIVAVSMIGGCNMNNSNTRGWNHVRTVRIYGKENRLSTDDYSMYLNSRYVENIDFLRYNYCTTEKGEIPHFDENGIQLYTAEGIKTLKYHVGKPVFIFGYNLSLPGLLDLDFEISEGRMFEKDDECIIMRNSKWAEASMELLGYDDDSWNSLGIGDKIIFENNEYDIYKKFTVVGILKENINNDKNSNTRIIHTTLKSAEYFDILNQERENLTYIFHENQKKQFPMGYEAVVYLTTDSYDKFYRYVRDISDDVHSIEPIDSVSLEPLY